MTDYTTHYKKSEPYNYNYYYHRPPQRDRQSELRAELSRLVAAAPDPLELEIELSDLSQNFGIKKRLLYKAYQQQINEQKNAGKLQRLPLPESDNN